MSEIWEKTFAEKQLMWGVEPTQSAIFAKDRFVRMGLRDVLVPGVGYGRTRRCSSSKEYRSSICSTPTAARS